MTPRKYGTKKTTTDEGKTEYQKEYMREYRKRQKSLDALVTPYAEKFMEILRTAPETRQDYAKLTAGQEAQLKAELQKSMRQQFREMEAQISRVVETTIRRYYEALPKIVAEIVRLEIEKIGRERIEFEKVIDPKKVLVAAALERKVTEL